MQPGMTEVQVAGKRRRMLPEEVQADDEAIVIDEAEPADQAGPSHAEHSSSVSEPRRLQPERVHPGKLQAPDVAARVLHVEAKAPGKPPLAVTAPGHSLERSVGSDADSESSDASMSETDQPLQGEEELCSDDEVDSQDPDSESLQGTTVSQGSASASSTLSSSPDDAPAASGEVVVAHHEVQGMGLAVARTLEVYVADQHTSSVTSWICSQCVVGKLRCWQQSMGRKACCAAGAAGQFV